MTAQANRCERCGTSYALSMLSCPACHHLTFSRQLKELSAKAQRHATAGERSQELSTWRAVLERLPQGSRQHDQIAAKIEALVAAIPEAEREKPTPPRWSRMAGLGAFGLLLWKFKALIGFALTKGKLLLLGLTKMSTLLSMLLSIGVYWSLWGWPLAVGLVLSIYVHEMGHVVALRRLGIAASAPMFVPGLGAFIRSRQYPASPAEDAAVGLAGPIWGAGAAVACYAIALLWDAPFFAALARLGAWINLFNLLPAWTLDGGRGFRALTRTHRVIATAVIGGTFLLTGEGLLLLLAIAAALRTFAEPGASTAHRPTLLTYAALVLGLGFLSTVDAGVDPAPAVALLGSGAGMR